MEVDLTFSLRIHVDHPKKFRMIPLLNSNHIYRLFHENRVDLVFNFGGELFPPLSHLHLYPFFPTCVLTSLHQ